MSGTYPALRLPAPTGLRIREGDTGQEVYDPVRRAYVAFTPEEWVRQHVIAWLTEALGAPMALLSVERGLADRPGRTDVVVFDRSGRAWMLVECKAAGVALDQSVADQAARYNRSLGASYLAITNGLRLHAWDARQDPPRPMPNPPMFPE